MDKPQSLFPVLPTTNVEPNQSEDRAAANEKSWLKCTSFTVEAHPQQEQKKSRDPGEGFLARADAAFSSDTEDSGMEAPEGHCMPSHAKSKAKEKKNEGKTRKKRKSDLDKIIALESKSKKMRTGTHSLHDLHMWMSNEALRRGGHGVFAFDTSGCYENFAYESLYRMEVPNYYRTRCVGPTHGSSDRYKILQERFFSPKPMAKERSRKLKRYRIASGKKNGKPSLSLPPPAFLPFASHQECIKESDEQYVMRRTKEFNIATRERPFELHLWVLFANFQDEITKLLRRKGLEKTTAERKIAILERGLSFHPGAEELVLLLLECVEHIEDSESILDRWERVVASSSGSPRLWTAYIQWRKRQFGSFSVSSIDALYSRALQSLSAERARQVRLGVGGRRLVEIEEGLAFLALSSVHFDAQSGYTEIALMKIQCMLEWHFFRPTIPDALLPGLSMLGLFKKFWDKHVPKAGETGACGWGKWAEKEIGLGLAPESTCRDNSTQEEPFDEEEGWTGWVAVTKGGEIDVNSEDPLGRDSGHSESGSESWESVSSEELEEDEKELMARLGLKLEEDMAKLEQQKEIPPDVLCEWIKREKDRDAEQCIRDGNVGSQELGDDEFEDVQEWAFELDSPSIVHSLLFGCLEFLGVDVDNEVSSNDPVLSAVREHSESVSWTLNKYLSERMETSNYCRSDHLSGHHAEGPLFNRWFDLSPQRAQFVAQLLRLLSAVVKDSVALCDAWIQAELAGIDEGDMERTQAKCKKLLESHKDSIPLWIAYGRLETSLGRYKVARRAYDYAYRYLSSLPGESNHLKPTLAIHYAEMDIAHGTETSNNHALNLLYHLAAGGIYQDFKKSSRGIDCDDLTKAKRIYQEKIAQAVSCQRDTFDAQMMSWVIAGALFEEIVHPDKLAGKLVSANILRNVLEAVPENVRAQNSFLEVIQTRLCSKLLDIGRIPSSPPGLPPSEVRECILAALRVYEKSATLQCLLHTSELHANAIGRLSRHAVSNCQEHSSTLNNLLALGVSFVQSRSRLQPVKLFEKALSKKNIDSNPILWVLYLKLEISKGSTSSAKRVMLRAIRSCPWSKLIWKVGLEGLSGVFESREVGEYMDLMKNKGIKLRTDVYEVLLERLEMVG